MASPNSICNATSKMITLGASSFSAGTAAATTTATMPWMGFGTYLLERSAIPKVLPQAILELGYRRIDCAPVYFNEDVIGDVLQDSILGPGKIQRSDLFIMSKLPSPFHQRKHVPMAVKKTLADLRLTYLDMLLVHWPVAFHFVDLGDDILSRRGYENEDIDDSNGGKNIDSTVSLQETWLGMQDVVDQGLVKNIGLSNVPQALLHELLASKPRIWPVVNQIELHPYLQQHHLVEYCQQRGIHVQAYSPLGTPGYKENHEPVVLQDETLLRLASKHGVTPAQVALQWAMQRNTSVICKSTSPVHLQENIAVEQGTAGRNNDARTSQFVLSDQDMADIKSIDRHYRFFRPEDWWGPMGAVFH